MSLSLTNRDDIIANSYSIITENGSVVDVLDAVQSSVVGLPPSSLNTIEKLSAAISNDPNYFQTIQTSINTKAPISTTYTKTQVDSALNTKADQSTTYTKTQINTFLDSKPDDADLDLKADKATTYTKTEVATQIAAVVGSAPALLDTLSELAAALNNDANFATTITNSLAAKAPLANPTFTGTVTGITKAMVNLANVDNTSDANKQVSTATQTAFHLKQNTLTAGTASLGSQSILAGTIVKNIISGLAITLNSDDNGIVITGRDAYTKTEVNQIQTNLEASINAVPNNYYSKSYIDAELLKKASLISPALTGSATAINLTVSGTLINGTTNLLTSLNSKANTSDLLLLAPLASPALTGTATAVNLTVSGALVNGTTNVLTELGTKATTAAMSTLQTNLEASINAGSTTLQNNYYNKTSIDSSLLLKSDKTYVDTELNKKAVASTTYSKTEVNGLVALKTDKTTTDNSAVAWSAGYNTDGYHYIDTGSDALVVRTPSGAISAYFGGNAGGTATDGNITFYKTVSINKLSVSGDLTVAGNLDVIGNTNFANPYWIAAIINFTGGNPYFVRANGGRNTPTSLVRVAGQTTGIVQFDFPAHPHGINYLMSFTGNASYATICATTKTSTRIGVVIRESVSLLLADREIHVFILAY